MFPINRLNVLILAWAALGNASGVEAVQWPVHGGPVNQPVPQYLNRYPLPSLSESKPTPTLSPQPKLEFKRVNPSTSPIISRPIELVSPEPAELVSPEPARAPLKQLPQVTAPPKKQQVAPKKIAPKTPAAKKSATKKPAAKKAIAKKAVAKKAVAKENKPAPPAVNYDIYRDRNPLPIDPRKPNGICTTANGSGGCCGCGQTRGCHGKCEAPGLHGKPYQEREPGGCRCGDKKCGKCSPMFSLNWPRPFSAKLDEHFPDQAAARYRPCQEKRIVDVFDKFANFKLIDYQRTDNGYCGKGSDPYGCLGESRMIASGVAATGYAFPMAPQVQSTSSREDRSAARESFWY